MTSVPSNPVSLAENVTAVLTRGAPPLRGVKPHPPAHLTLLTVFRFVAAAWVLLFHLQPLIGRVFPQPLGHVISNGAYAMSFFFVLSGTVLAYSYFDLAATPRAAWEFYRARFARIYPAYALVQGVGALWLGVLLTDWARWGYLNALNLLGIQAWFPQAFVGLNNGTWSISCEFFFYLLFPALLPLLREVRRSRDVLRAVCYLSLFAGFLGLSDFAFAREGTFPLAYISPLIRLPEFLIGMLIGVALRRLPAGGSASVWPVVLAAAALLAVSCNTVYDVGLWTRVNVLVVPAVAALIFAAGRYEIAQPLAFTGRFWRVGKYLGHASFALFLAHLPLLIVLHALLKRGDAWSMAMRGSPAITSVIVGGVMLGSAVVLHEGFEKPMRRWLLRSNGAAEAGAR